nr:riboflavin synthase [Ipomoea trifida]
MAALSISSLSSSSSKPLNLIKSLRTPPILNLQTQQWLPSLNLKKPISIHSLKLHPLSFRFTQHRKPHRLYSSDLDPSLIKSLFTGIVEEMGEVRYIGYEDPESFTMKIGAKIVLNSINLGDSIAVTGTTRISGQFGEGIDAQFKNGRPLRAGPRGRDQSDFRARPRRGFIVGESEDDKGADKVHCAQRLHCCGLDKLTVVDMFDDECWICLTMSASTSCWESKM